MQITHQLGCLSLSTPGGGKDSPGIKMDQNAGERLQEVRSGHFKALDIILTATGRH